jgi:uncharacterized protein (TIGR02266 family)
MSYVYRRAHARAHLHVEVTLESDHNFYIGVAGEVSEGGVFVATYCPPPVGSLVTIDIQLPETSEPMLLAGVVRWVRSADESSDERPTGCGIQWLEPSADAVESIRDFVARRDPVLYNARPFVLKTMRPCYRQDGAP